MTRLEDRRTLMDHIAQARAAGARLRPACAIARLDARTLQRWQAGEGLAKGDRRPTSHHPVPSHALSQAERPKIVAVCNEPRFAETPPARIVPALADEGIYIARRAWPDEPPRTRSPAACVSTAAHPHRHPPGRGLVLGRDVSAGTNPGPLVLPLPARSWVLKCMTRTVPITPRIWPGAPRSPRACMPVRRAPSCMATTVRP